METKQIQYPGENYSVVLTVQPLCLKPGFFISNVRIIRKHRSEIQAAIKSERWQFDLEPGYGIPEINSILDKVRSMNESEATLFLAAAGISPDFIFRWKFQSNNNILGLSEVQDLESGDILYKAKAF